MACGHRAAYECIAAFSATDFRPDLAKVDVPTLVIHGDDDQIVPFEVGGKRSAEMVAGATLKVYDGQRPRAARHRPRPPARRPARVHRHLTDTEEDTTMNDSHRPDTIVLVHGLWMTPRSWEDWVSTTRPRASRS